MITRILLVASIISIGCGLLSGSAAATEVTDFKAGLVCDSGGENSWICLQTEDIQLTGQGRCVYNGDEEACTWYGFSFRYSKNKPGTELECEYERNIPASMGNPKEIVAENVSKGTYSLMLEEKEGTFFNPQYSVLALRQPGAPNDSIATRCSIDGKEVARFRFNIIRPEIPAEWSRPPG